MHTLEPSETAASERVLSPLWNYEALRSPQGRNTLLLLPPWELLHWGASGTPASGILPAGGWRVRTASTMFSGTPLHFLGSNCVPGRGGASQVTQAIPLGHSSLRTLAPAFHPDSVCEATQSRSWVLPQPSSSCPDLSCPRGGHTELRWPHLPPTPHWTVNAELIAERTGPGTQQAPHQCLLKGKQWRSGSCSESAWAARRAWTGERTLGIWSTKQISEQGAESERHLPAASQTGRKGLTPGESGFLQVDQAPVMSTALCNAAPGSTLQTLYTLPRNHQQEWPPRKSNGGARDWAGGHELCWEYPRKGFSSTSPSGAVFSQKLILSGIQWLQLL